MQVSHIRASARMAGNVIRYHGWPTLRQQTNAHHTWNVMRIYRELWGELTPGVCDMALYHDAGELNGADAPHDVKQSVPGLKEACDLAEARGLARIGAPSWEGRVTDQERLRFKACDLLEMAEFATEEQELGNKLMIPVVYNIEWSLHHHLLKMEPDDALEVLRFIDRLNARTVAAGWHAKQINPDGVDRR